MELSNYDKSRVRFHLGYNNGAQIPAGDASRLEEAMAMIPDQYWYSQIAVHIKRCDVAWKASSYFPDDWGQNDTPTGQAGSVNPSRMELISGDVERAILTSDPLKGDEYFREIYLRECDRLAESLYVANYRRPEVRRYCFERAGSEFIMAVPGPSDTCTLQTIVFHTDYR